MILWPGRRAWGVRVVEKPGPASMLRSSYGWGPRGCERGTRKTSYEAPTKFEWLSNGWKAQAVQVKS